MEENKQIEEAEVKEEYFMQIKKEEIMTIMMEVNDLENPNSNVFNVKYLSIMKGIVGIK
jgi:hypothetical protein